MKNISKQRIIPAFEDERGAIYDLLDKESISHIGMITCNKGSVRGNHYHTSAKQITYVLSGKIEVRLRHEKEKGAKAYSVVMEKSEILSIPPLVSHSIKAIDDAVILIFTDRQRSDGGYEEDTHRVEM
jgi:dTDP-4-dehydrorhamnose 3,5-epimerase-like enzyme